MFCITPSQLKATRGKVSGLEISTKKKKRKRKKKKKEKDMRLVFIIDRMCRVTPERAGKQMGE